MSLIDLMQEKYNLTIDENDRILLEPEEWGFTTYPIKNPKTAMRVTQEEYFGLLMHEYYIDLNTRTVHPITLEMLQEEEYNGGDEQQQ